MCNTVRNDATYIQKRKGFFMESKRNAQILDIAVIVCYRYREDSHTNSLQFNSL